jgi:hypothetical protein
MAPLADDFAGVNRSMSAAERGRFRPDEANIPRQLSGDREVTPAVMGPNGEVAVPAVTEPITQPISEVTGLRSALTDASREAMTAGRTNEARIINQHVEALDTYLDHAVPEALRTDYDAARAATVDFHDRFTRPQTAIAQTLDRTEGVYRQPNSAVAAKFVQSDDGRINDFQALMRETGHDDRTVSAVRDQILADVRDRGLLDKPEQLREYLGRYNTVLSDPRFNSTRASLDNAAALRRSLDTAVDSQSSLTRELGTAERPGTSTVGKYLQYGDERSQDVEGRHRVEEPRRGDGRNADLREQRARSGRRGPEVVLGPDAEQGALERRDDEDDGRRTAVDAEPAEELSRRPGPSGGRRAAVSR